MFYTYCTVVIMLESVHKAQVDVPGVAYVVVPAIELAGTPTLAVAIQPGGNVRTFKIHSEVFIHLVAVGQAQLQGGVIGRHIEGIFTNR